MSDELNEAIAHWRRLRACETPEDFLNEGWYSNSCQLCMNRYSAGRVVCYMAGNPCPVYLKTGVTDCRDTPYNTAEAVISSFCDTKRHPIFLVRAAIDYQIDFLDSLTEDKSCDD